MSTATLLRIQVQMNYYGYPILLVLGNIGNIFILILFYRQRHNPCSIYLIGSAIANLLYLTFGGFIRIFSNSLVEESLRALIVCKLSSYIPRFFGQVTKTLLIFACIDRYMITSKDVRLRAFSTPKRAIYITCAIYVIWAIIPSHILVGITISNKQCAKIGWYVTFYAFYALLFIGCILSLIICVFSYLTMRNIKQLHNRIQPTGQNVNSNDHTQRSLKRRDHSLLVLVLAEAIIFIITTAPFTIVCFETMITSFLSPAKSLALLESEIFALNVSTLMIFVFSATPFYTYIVASSSFRQEFRQLIVNSYRNII